MAERPGFVCIACPDVALLRRAVDEVQLQYGFGNGQAERLVFWGDEDLPPRFWEALALQGFVASLRVVVLRNAHNLPAETWKRLSSALARPNAQVLPVLCLEGAWEKGQPKIPAYIEKLACMQFARAHKWFKQVSGLDARALRDLVRALVRAEGMQASAEALDALCAVLPLDAAAVEGEIQKVALYAASRRVSPDAALVLDVADAALVGEAPDFNIFAFIRQLQNGNSAGVWTTILREAERADDMLFSLLGLLQREARLIWQTLANDTSHMSPRDAESRREVARRLGVAGLATLWDALHSAELAVKTGRLSPSQALDALIGELTALFSAR